MRDAGFGIGAKYRPDTGADVIVALNDTAWMGFLLGWVFFALEMVVVNNKGYKGGIKR